MRGRKKWKNFHKSFKLTPDTAFVVFPQILTETLFCLQSTKTICEFCNMIFKEKLKVASGALSCENFVFTVEISRWKV